MSRHLLCLSRPSILLSGAVTACLGCAAAGLAPQGVQIADLANEVLQQYPQENTVARSQKPDSEKPAQTPQSILDLAAYKVPNSPEARVSTRIRATVNGVAILEDELNDAVYQSLVSLQSVPEPERTKRRKELVEKELEALIDREVILQDLFARLKGNHNLDKLKEAAGKEFDKKMRDVRKRMNIATEEEFKVQLKAQGVSLDGARRQSERTFMATEYMQSRVAPAFDRIGHEQIREYYQQHPEEFAIQDRVVWLDIFIDARQFPTREQGLQFAQQLASQAQSGADFLTLAKQYDKGDSSYRNGEGFGQRRGEIKPPEAEAILFQMKEGDIGPVIELANGFHVIKLKKREYAGIKPFDEKTQSAIKNKLRAQVWEIEYKRVLADLKRKAAIEISNPAP